MDFVKSDFWLNHAVRLRRYHVHVIDRHGLCAPSAKLTSERAEPASALSAESLAVPQEEPKAPAWTTRNSTPGPRGCWALNKRGDPCGSARRADGDYCNAHSGLGVAADPKGHSAVGTVASAESRRRRAALRLVIGSTRLDTPRAALRGLAVVNAERMAGRVVGAAISPQTPDVQAAKLCLDIIDAVDPRLSTVTEVTGELDPSQLESLSLSQLMSFAHQHGIEAKPA